MEKKIKLASLSPNLIVDDVNKAVEYYAQKIGFTLVASVPEQGTFNWAMVARDGVTLMFQSLESIKEDMPALQVNSKGGIGTFFIEMEGIDELYESLKGKADIAFEIRTTFYGKREFGIRDLNGYFLVFAEDVK
ncbi:MAG: VOC family protein [Bacteroidota bacterium]